MVRLRGSVSALLLFICTAGLYGAPAATELIPASAPAGARVIVAGTALDSTTAIAFPSMSGGSVTAAVVSSSPAAVEVVVPSTAATGSVTVTAGGASIGSFPFTLLPDAPYVKTATLAASTHAHDLFTKTAGVSVDTSTGYVYVSDTLDNQIVKLAPNGAVAAVYGNGNPGLINGPASQAELKHPAGLIFVPAQSAVYVADAANNVIRRIDANGAVSTFAAPEIPLSSTAPARSRALTIQQESPSMLPGTSTSRTSATTPSG